MKLKLIIAFLGLLVGAATPVLAQKKMKKTKPLILPADARPDNYLPLLASMKVAVVMNQASVSCDTLLLDRLLLKGVTISKIFVPEHGFRGNADAGEHIANSVDSATGIPVISLYGSHKMPTAAEMEGVDVLVYDLQDVGVRFYTYISTLQYCMQACAQSGALMLVLDRPNPNGFYVDGPVLDTALRSFVGMQPIPIVYGMTAGEYALMLRGEGWIPDTGALRLKVVPCIGYTHTSRYTLPVPPSPNLRDMAAVYAYPALCLFEGTPLSVGRGTDKPFRQFGSPVYKGKYPYTFSPVTTTGARHPLFEGQQCYGRIVAETERQVLGQIDNHFYLGWLIDAWDKHPGKDHFFTPFFDKLAGTLLLKKQISLGLTADAIAATWQKELQQFKRIRKKYLLYPDFE